MLCIVCIVCVFWTNVYLKKIVQLRIFFKGGKIADECLVHVKNVLFLKNEGDTCDTYGLFHHITDEM